MTQPADKPPRAIVTVWLDVEPQWEEEFNRWYDEEHVPERLACDGFLRARRYKAVGSSPKYLCVYELESLAALETERYKALAAGSEWTRRMRPHKFGLQREVYVEIASEFPPYTGPRHG